MIETALIACMLACRNSLEAHRLCLTHEQYRISTAVETYPAVPTGAPPPEDLCWGNRHDSGDAFRALKGNIFGG